MTIKTTLQLPITIDKRSHESYEDQLYSQIKHLVLRHQVVNNLCNPFYLAKELELPIGMVLEVFDRLAKNHFFTKIDDHTYDIAYKKVMWETSDTFSSIADMIIKSGEDLNIDTFNYETLICDKKLSELTSFPIGTPLYVQDRIYYGNGRPKAYYKVYFNANLIKDAQSKENLTKPYHVFTGYNIKESQAARYIQSLTFPDYINKYLDQMNGTAGFKLVENLYNNDGLQTTFAEGYLNINYIFQYKTQLS